MLGDGGAAATGFAWRSKSVDSDDEDLTYLSQADTVLDADTSGDIGSVSTMATDQWADSVMFDAKPPARG
jgi:hypothetical protein